MMQRHGYQPPFDQVKRKSIQPMKFIQVGCVVLINNTGNLSSLPNDHDHNTNSKEERIDL